jgi:hypothetical protein
MLNHPLATTLSPSGRCYSPGPWQLRLLASLAIAITLALAYQVLFPLVAHAMFARQWLG